MAFSYYRTVYLSDTDAAGVIYFSRLMTICHESYEMWLEKIGISLQEILKEKTIAIPIIHADIDFFKPIICGDKLQINLEFKLIQDDEFNIHYQIFSLNSAGKMLAMANTRHVCINLQTRKRISLPKILICET